LGERSILILVKTHLLSIVVDILQIAGQVDLVSLEELGLLENLPEENNGNANENHAVYNAKHGY